MDVPCSELASALGFQVKKAEDLQETLQRVLDRREEERQSKELLQLYLKAVESEDRGQEEPSQAGRRGTTVSFYMCFTFNSWKYLFILYPVMSCLPYAIKKNILQFVNFAFTDFLSKTNNFYFVAILGYKMQTFFGT